MTSKVDRIMLFTLSACPMGRSMGTVIKEVSEIYQSIKIETIFVDRDIERTNTFRIKSNPTTLLQSTNGQVVARFEGFYETEVIREKIESIDQGQAVEIKELDKNSETVEQYTIYLYKDGKAKPVSISHKNYTSVKAPRITAIKVLLKSNLNGYSHPFSSDVELTLVKFQGQEGKIYLSMNEEPSAKMRNEMQELITKTLEVFGVDSIELIINEREE